MPVVVIIAFVVGAVAPAAGLALAAVAAGYWLSQSGYRIERDPPAPTPQQLLRDGEQDHYRD